MKIPQALRVVSELLATAARLSQSALLLVLRLWWGWSFFLTGRGKLVHLGRTAEYFASLDIPLPHVNALVAGSAETVGGLLLMAGLWTRFASIPLAVTLLTAYATAERDALKAILQEPDRFTGAAPFLFLLATAVVFAFGPGRFSIDHLLMKRQRATVVSQQPDVVEPAGNQA